MKFKFLMAIAVVFAMLFAGFFATSASATPGSDHKIWICHVPPGNPEAAHSIHVDVAGWNGHKNHKSDYEGKCATPEPEPTEEPTTEPTEEPTEEPTTEPTEEPITEPTEEPTTEPTEEPTTEPTEEPTTEPTEEPITEPTEEPTTEPTEEPITDSPTTIGTPEESYFESFLDAPAIEEFYGEASGHVIPDVTTSGYTSRTLANAGNVVGKTILAVGAVALLFGLWLSWSAFRRRP